MESKQERPVGETVWRRAWSDSLVRERFGEFAWEGGIAIALYLIARFAVSAAYAQEATASANVAMETFLFLVGTASIGGVVRYGWNLFRAPYRQRDEAIAEAGRLRDAQKAPATENSRILEHVRSLRVDFDVRKIPATRVLTKLATEFISGVYPWHVANLIQVLEPTDEDIMTGAPEHWRHYERVQQSETFLRTLSLLGVLDRKPGPNIGTFQYNDDGDEILLPGGVYTLTEPGRQIVVQLVEEMKARRSAK